MYDLMFLACAECGEAAEEAGKATFILPLLLCSCMRLFCIGFKGKSSLGFLFSYIYVRCMYLSSKN